MNWSVITTTTTTTTTTQMRRKHQQLVSDVWCLAGALILLLPLEAKEFRCIKFENSLHWICSTDKTASFHQVLCCIINLFTDDDIFYFCLHLQKTGHRSEHPAMQRRRPSSQSRKTQHSVSSLTLPPRTLVPSLSSLYSHLTVCSYYPSIDTKQAQPQ